MERLKVWLAANGISIVRPRIGDGGLYTFRLRPPHGADFEVDFYAEDLEADPDNAIEFIRRYLVGRQIRL